MKKNKTWDGDGVVVLGPTFVSFRLDESERFKERSRIGSVAKFTTEGVFPMGPYELEVMGEITDVEQVEKIKGFTKSGTVKVDEEPQPVKRVMAPIIKGEPKTLNKQFKQVLLKHDQPMKPRKGEPLFDPSAEGAIVMKKRHDDDTDVVIDPFLTKSLRPHQVRGVKFLYECVMDHRGFDGHGALLADDMGLGKTLQTIALIWTLLKQSPEGFSNPVASKILIACPVTLVGNWKREFKKWLPMNRVNVLTLHSKNTTVKDKQDIKNFSRAKVYHVLIMGYEKILNMKNELPQCEFDLLICDEGHRLKNNSNKTLQALNSLNIERKVLLSGTPIQNDLSEFFNIIDFINPGILGTFNQFKKNYMNPILRARETNCHDEDVIQNGEDKSQELISLTKPFILRRTASVILNHLPPRTDVVLFCPPTELQMKLFNEVLNSHRFTALVNSATNTTSTLGLITMFKKICNSPSLVTSDKLFKEFSNKPVISSTISGKITVLLELLKEIYQQGEKVVLVSNYTQTLDILQSLLEKLNFTYSRLDGSTPNKDRDSLVNKFNTSPQSMKFAFLLSSKSGGVGLNLIGASRLILFDNDWNPSVDLQAMARIHRDGQKRPVFIYRLITTGTIDEKIFQRQLMKNNLSDKFLDNKNESKDNVFNMNDLKDLFTVQRGTRSNTHDLIECGCDGLGEDVVDSDEDDEDDEDDEGDENDEDQAVENVPKKNSWVSALDYKNESMADDRNKTIKKCLVDFKHFDPTKVDPINVPIGDLAVENIVMRDPSLVSYILTKVNKPSI
jgi:DNA repair and recombination protein RAD54B